MVNKPYYSVSDAAEALNLTKTTIYALINHPDSRKTLTPINPTNFRGDKGYLFKREDVEQLKTFFQKKGLTCGAAAQKLGRSTTFIHKLIQEGKLSARREEHRGKQVYFLDEAEVTQFLTRHPNAGKQQAIHDRKRGYFLFQPFQKGDARARIVHMARLSPRKMEVQLNTADGCIIGLEQAIEEGWKPSLIIQPRKPITTYGYANFRFPMPQTLDSIVYRIIETLFEQVGPANLRIELGKGKEIQVEVRKSVLAGLTMRTHPDLLEKMKLFLVSGELIEKHDGTIIETGLSPITFYLPEEKKRWLLQQAADAGVTLQELLERKVEEGYAIGTIKRND